MSKKILYYEDQNKIVLYDKEYSRHQIYSWFIEQNKSREELMALLGASKTTTERVLRYFNIKKDKRQAELIAQKTMQKNYGVDAYPQSSDYLEKIRNTSLKNYGVEHYAKSSKVQKAREQTCLDKYGFKTSALNEEVIRKKEETCLKKYGVKNPAQSEGWAQHKRDLCLQKNGCLSPGRKNWTIIAKEVLNTKEDAVNYLTSHPRMSTIELTKIFGCSLSQLDKIIKNWGIQNLVIENPITSYQEKEVLEFIHSLGFNPIKAMKYLNKQDIDIYLSDLHLGVEYNGTYWHSLEQKDKNYHFEKSKLAQEKGIRLIHIYEYEWNDSIKRPIIESMLKIALGVIDNKIYARECEIKAISNVEARPFNEKNHLQGHRNAQVTYGLFYKGELVQLMSFSKTKYNRNLKNDNSWEIIRGCPGSNNIVVGGVSKLFKHFVKNYDPEQVFSYCDFNKFDGKGYEAIGMRFIGYTGPDMKWIMPDWQVVERQPSKHKELKEKAISQIWGAGSKKYLWTKE